MADEKKVAFCSKDYDMDSGEISFTFGNGTVVSANINDFPAEMQRKLMFHGASQKGGDSYASAKGNYTEGIAAVQGVLEQLKAGAWRSAAGEGESRPRLGELAAAIARIKAVAVEVAMAAVEKASEEQRKTWRSNAKVKSVIATIRAEAAAKALEDSAEKDLEIAL